uniref:Tax1-binding protein 3 n=1 Tax=Ciona intestinalis TaxID=7719 RepID=H2XVB4_CIOIN|nr:tax1-binding protein 3 [Ciona intestinalis]|eukprot:XP_002126764.1 tax1-binding protein 3 [Ciona intestinalis]
MAEYVQTFESETLCECIEIVKDVQDGNLILGFAIGGGIDQDASKNPFIPNDSGIFVTRVYPGGPADKAGLKVGDKILQVNGYDVTMATQKQAKKRLVKNQRIVRLKVTRPNLIEAELLESTEKDKPADNYRHQEYI